MSTPIVFSHRNHQLVAHARRNGGELLLEPDAKSQVTLRYENGRPVEVHSIVVSTQHDETVAQDGVRDIVRPYIAAALPAGWSCPADRPLGNTTGRFVVGGQGGDCGLTGGQHLVRTYGGTAGRQGGVKGKRGEVERS